MKPLVLAAVIGTAFSCALAEGAVYNIHLATDNAPDYTDMESFVQSATAAWQTPQEKSIAVWRWGRRSRRQTSCAGEDGRGIWDPILHYNSYGAMNCGIISSLNIASWLQLGYRGRYIQLGDHTVSEVSWDDGKTWHLFDSSMSVFCYNHAGEVASCDEIKSAAACELSAGQSEPGHFYFYHYAPQCGTHTGPTGWRCASDQPVGYNRTLLNGASSYTDGFSVDKYCQVARYGHRYTLNLRPYESYTRYWTPLDREKEKGGEGLKDMACFRTLTSKTPDPDASHGLYNIRGNGRWLLKPDLSAKDCRNVFYEDSGAALRAEDGAGPNLHPSAAAADAWVVFKVYAANVITSMRIEAEGLRADAADVLQLAVSRDAGLHWTTVWQAEGAGRQTVRATLGDEVAGVTQCLVKVQMRAAKDRKGVGLDSLQVTTITQVNRRALPLLTRGTNQVLLRADAQVETAELWPPLHDGAYKRTAIEEDGVFSDQKPDGMYKATLGAGVNGRECSVTWRLGVPSDIVAVTYAVIATNRGNQSSVSLRHSWDGSRFDQFYAKSDGGFPMDDQVFHTFAGAAVPGEARQACFRGVFSCKSGAATYNMPGIQDLLMRISHKPRDPAFQPIEVTYCWTEHRDTGDVTRSHTELVRSLPHRYAINVAGRRDPTMNYVRINLQGSGPDGKAARYGYPDGVDVGGACEPVKVAYRWGQPVSIGKPYTASRNSSTESGNPDTGGRELTNGIIIAPTDYVSAGGPVREATAFWDAGDPVTFVVDLEKTTPVGGVRISTHQPNAKYCHPAGVEVSVSDDGRAWRAAGTVRHDDLWNPPGDYEPWEHDDTPAYAGLPAGGRLAYPFPLVFQKPLAARYVRFICTPQKGAGMGLSELGIFSQAEVRPWPADITLPDIASKR